MSPSSKILKQERELLLRSGPPSIETIVYITDLLVSKKNDDELASSIRHRINTILRINVINIQCHSKLGFGIIRVENNQIKEQLIRTRKITLDQQDDSEMITFSETFELTTHIVLDITNEKNTEDLPKPDEVVARWIQVFNGKKPRSCHQVSIQFPNIYLIILDSLDESFETLSHQDFAIKNRCATVYLGADCSYFEDLSKSTTEDQLREAIAKAIGLDNLSPLSLHIELNKQANSACVIATKTARKWTTQSFIYLGDKPILKKKNLTCRLILSPIPENCNINSIVNHTRFDNKAKIVKHHGDKLILEILDKNIFDDCIKVGALCIEDKISLIMEIYTAFSDPEECEINADTWYENEMLRYKTDIMPFLPNFDHNIFRLKWNSQLWLEQFKRWSSPNPTVNRNTNTRDSKGASPDQMRHRLRVTVMLNTIAQIRRKSYIVGNREIKLNLDQNLQTIVYNHHSKLKHSEPMPVKRTPYEKTEIKVVNEDCLVVYERLMREGKKPLLLNMASATSPGGGYRKGDGAQEENLFRRSDYFRSLDVGLDEYQAEPSERFYCTSNCDLDSHFNSKKMYPMDEYGAIYTSGLTVFRQPEQMGYEYMDKPLHGVCSLAMAAYREPKLDGNMLASKYAVGMRKKIENIFVIAYHHHHDSLVLSALGCGAFRNPPDHVAKLFRSVIEQYAGFFESIVFAIIDDHNTRQLTNPQGNVTPFQRELHGLIVKPIMPVKQTDTVLGPYRFLSDGVTVSDICIFDLTLCHFGATCQNMYDSNHARQFSHPPLCIQALTGTCTQNDIVHMSSFIHRNLCKYGVQCRNIDDLKHAQGFEHPSYCPQRGDCQDLSDNHEKAYRHLPSCKYSRKCTEFRKHSKDHCTKFRHCILSCPNGNYCANFHDKKHIDEYQHPFPPPCLLTPYHCPLHDELTQISNTQNLSDKVQQHCLDFSHVCCFGRNCTETNLTHKEKSIHIARLLCPYDKQCDKLVQEDHLNSFTHSNIRDIRLSCKYADKCRNRHDQKHISKFRHAMTFDDSSVVRYFNLNENIDFVHNQRDNIARVTRYIESEKWKQLSSGSIADEITDWIRTVQPVHRCSPEIFDSILLHGHVMGREYMEHLKKPKFVANCVLEHNQIRRIEQLKLPGYANHAREYVTALVDIKYKKKNFSNDLANIVTQLSSSYDDDLKCLSSIVQKEETYLTPIISSANMKAIRTKAIEIAEASIKLFQNPAGIGYMPDKDLGTNKHIFSILGPHLGAYYGNVVIVFKREILHHPDANFTMQSATSYASGKAYKWRPWLGSIPSSKAEQIELFHKTKLHASVPDYEYATACELIALTSLHFHKKNMNIDLNMILKRWCEVDSHKTIEAHLPQLISLDYIDHVYMTQKIFEKLHENSRKAINEIFKDHITIKSYESEDDYNKFVVDELIKRFGQRDLHSISRPIRGAVLTTESTNLEDHFVLPLTISQAYEQYLSDHPIVSKNFTIYIYWQLMNGDMMLTLSNKQNPNGSQSETKCLICYIAPKPISSNPYYYEQVSYLNSGRPSQHESFINYGQYAASSTAFYVGCNTDDFMTFCLEIQPLTGMVILSHAGPNSIYNHEKISCTFAKSKLDLNKLEFVHVSAGTRSVPIRNLIVCFEPQSDLHPTYDTKFEKLASSSITTSSSDVQYNKDNADPDDKLMKPSSTFTRYANALKDGAIHIKEQVIEYFVGNHDSSLKPCPDSIYCLYQFSEDGRHHNSKYSHPCRFAELCRNPEPNLTHEPRQMSDCSSDKNCPNLSDPIHRSQYSHTGLPYFLVPCRDQKRCQNKSKKHLVKYSHGERVLETSETAQSHGKLELFSIYFSKNLFFLAPAIHASLEDHDYDQRTLCKWDSKCRNMTDAKHSKEFFHSAATQQDIGRHIPCKWGAQCRDQSSHHQAKYSHPFT